MALINTVPFEGTPSNDTFVGVSGLPDGATVDAGDGIDTLIAKYVLPNYIFKNFEVLQTDDIYLSSEELKQFSKITNGGVAGQIYVGELGDSKTFSLSGKTTDRFDIYMGIGYYGATIIGGDGDYSEIHAHNYGDGSTYIAGSGKGQKLFGAELVNTTLIAGNGGNFLYAVQGEASGNTRMIGGTGNDTFYGRQDSLTNASGGKGNDTYYVYNIHDIITENPNEGIDTVYAWYVDFADNKYALPENFENLIIDQAGDLDATGNSGNNFIRGNANNNVLEGLGGDDTLFGGIGRDTASYKHAAAGVTVDLRISDWQFTGADTGSDRLNSIENLEGSAFNDVLTGGSDSNFLYGGNGNDKLDGGTGGDRMYGGDGNDDYYVDEANDIVFEDANQGMDQVFSSVTYTLRPNIENLFLTGSDPVNGTGNNGNNYIRGNDAANVLEGGAGDDTLFGGNSRDTASYEHAWTGVTVSLSAAGRQNTGGAGADLLNGIENLRGSAFNDTLTGTSSAGGGNGENVFTGGTGADKFVFFAAAINGADRVTDFSKAEGDKLAFKGADYGFGSGHVLGAGQLTSGSVANGNGSAQFVYNTATHVLSWDTDGIAGGAIKIATLDNVGSLAASDFLFT